MGQWRMLGRLGVLAGLLWVGMVIADLHVYPPARVTDRQPVQVKRTPDVRRPITRQRQMLPSFVYLSQTLLHYRPLDATPLTYGAANATQPALASDGIALLYRREQNGQADLYLLPHPGGEALNLTQSPAIQEETPVFSPDGKTIAFAANRQGDWDIYLMDRDGRNVRLGVGLAGSDELQPTFTADGGHLLFSSNRLAANWDIYSATISSTVWSRLTSDLAVERFPTLAADGATLAFRRELSTSVSNTVNSEIYVMSNAGSHTERLTADPAFDGYPVITPDGSGVLFVSDRSGRLALYSTNLGGVVEPVLDLPPGWHAQTPRLSADGRTLVFAAAVGETPEIYARAYASPLLAVGERGFVGLAGNCDWQAGVLAYGWANAGRVTGDPAYRQWIVDWVAGCLAAGEPIDHVNDGLLGYAALIAYQTTNEQRYLKLAESVADYLLTKAKRTADGVLTHLNDDTVWDDTLLVITPFLVEMGRVSHNRAYWDEAATQMVKHTQILQDPQSGLYHHAWQESSQQFLGAAYWGRGNGWVLVAATELLAGLPADHPQRATILANFQRHAAAIQPYQAPSGLWPTVVTQPSYYLESSGSALITAALLQGIKGGWLDRPTFFSTAQRARFALWRQVQVDGTVTGVSAPTGPMANDHDYNNIPISPFELYGQGVVLLMGSQ